MSAFVRIASLACLLVGGAALFGYWSLGQFDKAIDNMSAVSYRSVERASSILVESASTTESELNTISIPNASSTSTSSEAIASSTLLEPINEKNKTVSDWNGDLQIVFPNSDSAIYVGCQYEIVTDHITSSYDLSMSLVDAGTKKPAGPGSAGIMPTSTIPIGGRLPWKIVNVWPGNYYLYISAVNGKNNIVRSGVFEVMRLPEVSAEEKRALCENTKYSE